MKPKTLAVGEMVGVFEEEGVEAEVVQIGNKDAEGLQTMRVLARNMSFLMKSISLGIEKYGLPKTEEHAWTHFIMD